MLLVCLISIRLGTAVTASVRKWLDREELTLLSVRYKGGLRDVHKDSKRDILDFTDLTDCTKLTDV